jgi:ribosomal protein S18 acetylase RimI-like enzyme
MTESTAIRQAHRDDLEALEWLDARAWDETNSPTGPYRPSFGTTRRLEDTWVALLDGRIVGFFALGLRTTLESNRHVAALRVLAVAQEYRGRGIGAALVRRSIEEARRRGARKLSLTVLGSNERAIRFYERESFVVEGRLRGEFLLGGQWIDDVIMARSLD